MSDIKPTKYNEFHDFGKRGKLEFDSQRKASKQLRSLSSDVNNSSLLEETSGMAH
jgi:hypothetical protein